MSNDIPTTLTYTCPGYDFFAEKWKRCRDVYARSDRIKEKSEVYLPKSR